MGRSSYKRIKTKFRPGYGGIRCVCCNFARPSLTKKWANRALRRKLKRELG